MFTQVTELPVFKSIRRMNLPCDRCAQAQRLTFRTGMGSMHFFLLDLAPAEQRNFKALTLKRHWREAVERGTGERHWRKALQRAADLH